MTINYSLDVRERFARLLQQRADQSKKAELAAAKNLLKVEQADSEILSHRNNSPAQDRARSLQSGEERIMVLVTLRELYVSSNGDKWEITEDEDKRLFIRHTPNQASGGRQRILTTDTFLTSEHSGPQQDAFKKL